MCRSNKCIKDLMHMLAASRLFHAQTDSEQGAGRSLRTAPPGCSVMNSVTSRTSPSKTTSLRRRRRVTRDDHMCSRAARQTPRAATHRLPRDTASANSSQHISGSSRGVGPHFTAAFCASSSFCIICAAAVARRHSHGTVDGPPGPAAVEQQQCANAYTSRRLPAGAPSR